MNNLQSLHRMKYLLLLSFCPLLWACQNNNTAMMKLQIRVDSLSQELQHGYKPGLGEWMSGIQVHHNKLWFAGQYKNWALADFEMHEIMEAIDDIKQFETDRKETKSIGMIMPALDSVNVAIQSKNLVQFNRSFVLLTNTCNACHRANAFDFNVVVIPTTPPFSNQSFNTK